MHDRNSRLQGRHGLPARGPMNAGLAGTGLVTDDLYLMTHHETSGSNLRYTLNESQAGTNGNLPLLHPANSR
jgi:hypothetical protein